MAGINLNTGAMEIAALLADEFFEQTGIRVNPLSIEIIDESGKQMGIENNRLEVNATQLDLFTTFNDLLKEAKKINFQLAIITDCLITNEDVEV